MFCFLRKIIPFRRHIIDTISPSTSHQFLCVQSQCVPARSNFRYYSSISPNEHSFTVSYLIDTCGFSPQDAAWATKYVSFETPEKPDLVINFLKNHGFSKPQILRFTKELPQLLRSDPEKAFLPKIEFFKSKGVLSSDIPKLLCSCPNIMRRSLDKRLVPSFDHLQQFFQSDDKFIAALKCCSRILIDHSTVLLNLKLLREAGVPESKVIKLLELHPRTVTKSTDKFKIIVKEVGEMGFDPLKHQFITAVYALSSLSKSTWSKKANVYKKWGWSDNDIVVAFRRFPFCMKASEDKIEAILQYLIHQLGINSSDIIKYPYVLGFSLNKRIVPRGAVFQVLLSKGLVKKEIWPAVFKLYEKGFLRRFVFCHDLETSELFELYQSKLDLAREMKSG